MPRKFVNRRLLWVLMAAGFLAMFTIPLSRLSATLLALHLGLGEYFVGALSAAFALLPIFFSIGVGQLNDGGGGARSIAIGMAATIAGCFGLWLVPPNAVTLLCGVCLLGIGQTFTMSALQYLSTLTSTRYQRDNAIGDFMVALTMGTALGPALISLVGTPDVGETAQRLLLITSCSSIALLIACAIVVRLPPRSQRKGAVKRPPASVRTLMRSAGLPWFVAAGSLATTMQDLMLIFLPVLSIERQIPLGAMGLLLSSSGVAVLAARFMFSRVSRLVGHRTLFIITMLTTACGVATLAAPVPLWVLFGVQVINGFSIGLATTTTLSLVLAAAPIEGRATAITMRITGNRLSQFLIPLLAGSLAASFGIGSVFPIAGLVLLGSGAGALRHLPPRRT